MYYSVIHKPNNLIGHKVARKNGFVLRLPQSGAGLGDLFRSIVKWITPLGKKAFAAGKSIINSLAGSNLAKETASTLKQEATKAGINIAQSALRGENIKEAAVKESKKAAKNLGASVSKSLEQYRPIENNIRKNKIRKPILNRPPKKRRKIRDNLT